MADSSSNTPDSTSRLPLPHEPKPSWRIRVFVGGLIGLLLGLTMRPVYDALPSPALNAKLQHDTIIYGGMGFLGGGGIGFAMYIARLIRNSRKAS